MGTGTGTGMEVLRRGGNESGEVETLYVCARVCVLRDSS